MLTSVEALLYAPAMRHRAFRHVREALDEGRACASNLHRAGTFDDFNRHWRAWLRAVQRVWNKLEAVCHEHPKFNAIKSQHVYLERADPLLRYIKMARDADEHSVEELVRTQLGIRKIAVQRMPSQPGVYIEKVHTELGNLRVYSGTGRVGLSLAVGLVPVTNRGVRADPPDQHCGTPISPPTLQRVVELTMAYFDDLLARAERECERS